MIVIGADTHKATHALAAVDAGSGRGRGSREKKAEAPGHLQAVRWARALDDERVWAIEDCRHVSRRLEQSLLAAGEWVGRVPPHRMGASRRGERERGKSERFQSTGHRMNTRELPRAGAPARTLRPHAHRQPSGAGTGDLMGPVSHDRPRHLPAVPPRLSFPRRRKCRGLPRSTPSPRSHGPA